MMQKIPPTKIQALLDMWEVNESNKFAHKVILQLQEEVRVLTAALENAQNLRDGGIQSPEELANDSD